MFSPISASENIKDEFISYISTLFHISDKEYARQFLAALEEDGAISKGPYLHISDSYKTGESLKQLIVEGEASPLFEALEGSIPDGEKEIQMNRGLYLHQVRALRKTNRNKNLIVTTGTGSGKTECFIIPIINHLLREMEQGSLTSGVRAILIYPMNALANDQMKRLRNLLKSYPEITFGVYNSSTKQNHQDGIAEYGKIYKDANGHPLKPLPNEIVSRDQMQASPPHILVTNYAMLEYMMLRPKDDLVFSGAKLRYLVLDEAHIYRGATGMETSLLLNRLKARISNPANVLHILTSATLGGKEADKDIVKFADTLCNAEFHAEDIIRSESEVPSFDSESIDVPLFLFAELVNPEKPLNDIVAAYDMSIPDGQSDAEFLYDLCVSAPIYRQLRRIVEKPMTVPEITSVLNHSFDVTQQDVANIISVAVQAEKNKSALIKARYHMFAKALEGSYITLGSFKKLSLTRTCSITKGDEEWKVFECAVCDDCGSIAVAGREIDGHLEFANNSYDPDIEYYLLRDSHDGDFDGEEDDDDDESTGEIGKNDYLLCSKCGAIIHESLKSDPPCTCGLSNYVRVRMARKTDARGDGKCPRCNFGNFKIFYLGYDAATAVLGTSLFEELPESEKVLKSKKTDPSAKKGLFRSSKIAPQVDIIKKKRQFLSFSDSRGEAAFFASYMTASYREFLRRRGIWHMVEKNQQNMTEHPWEIQHFVDELTSYFDSYRTFAEPGDKGSENLTAVSRKNAWIAVLNEMVNARRSTSLVSMGLIQFHYKGNGEDIMGGVAETYGQKIEDVKALFNILAMDIVYHGAMEGECDLTDDEREYIFYSAKPKRIKRCRDLDKDKKKAYIAGWSSAVRKNGKLLKNGRLKRVMKVLDLDEERANELLQMYWDEVLCGEESLSTAGNDEFYFNTEKFTISAGAEDVPIYTCNVCGKTTMTNCKDMCTTLKCDGHLRPITHAELIDNNHYAKLYRSSLMQPLHIKEHTAQLGREEQQKYQEMFVNKEINALSCSTTFEMGVDVGDLETVYLRNMPPSPANYVQRAGRAGRGRNSAAFSMTYSKLSSHDFTYYKNPENMITGKIGVPLFTVQNEKVILRHIFAVALSDFFSKQVDVYNSNNADVLLNGDGWERLYSYLNSKPEHLKEILKASIPPAMHNIMGITDYCWIEKLIGKDGVMSVAVEEFRSTVDYYKSEVERLQKDGLLQEAAAVEKKLFSYRRGKGDNRGRNELIEFLVRNNILPKYGFPVDTVELYQNTNTATDKKLQMVRDLQLAISEYAPDAQVVADGKLYTSRYIRKLPQTTGQDWETAYIAQCINPSCQTWNHRSMEPDSSGEECVSCHEIISRWEIAIEPRKGFVADATPKDVPMRKPDKVYRSDDFYIGDVQRQIMQKYAFVMNDGNKFLMETSINDSLMVVCNDDFYVCPHCGYAESTTENMEDTSFNSHQKALKKKHMTPWGKSCEVKLVKNKLCHVFKTDVVRLVFATPQAGNLDVMLSVMYALLEALSSVLDIERTDIKGCLHKVVYNNNLIYSIVLYDAVAGGAGHVRRMVTEDGKVFKQVVLKAISITKGCTCNPSCYSCLRNYYNQKIHDRLNRKYGYDFLENYIGELESITDEEFEVVGSMI
ncbi:DEAD/DEAH box helicase [Clostridium sp. WB02_MRS01]|uniref:DEAD/DEAH box helicase n=1 Tax=Clostridium sp. WB02_MRS01 TaxID=2605777 RepID=UPI0012B225D3|nr:DEAD/DEAH box helicase [Clostridium sp. WB02_MRS01]MSS11527.1 DEAD/DEAH box helicase [Clostridium sp. WB02_MRS01]